MPDTKKILIVDDSEVNLFLMQTLFEDDPEIVVQVEKDSRLALGKLKEGQHDLLVLDLMMPYVSGFELLDIIRDMPLFEMLPVLIVSAKGDKATKMKALQYKILDFFEKPLKANWVESRIRSLL